MIEAEKRARDLSRMEHEIAVAREIQAGFLPRELPQTPGYSIAARFQPAREVAGDFYDAFPMSNGRRLGLVIADVCDKGVGAALFMALCRSLLRAFAQQHHAMGWMDRLGSGEGRRGSLPSAGSTALSGAIESTNRYMAENHGLSGMFASVFFGVLDPSTGVLQYINAGHNPPLILGGGTVRERLGRTGPVVGIFAEAKYGVGSVRLDPGDLLYLYTDGVTEAKDADGEFFGDARLAEALGEAMACASDALDMVEARLGRFVGEAAAHDDVTMLALQRAPSS
ncbi:MAG: PP2C family protein-serine/threonine phosphatase [Fimbriimonadaceae bacterium]|nr:PP2C family protein-serine/threonine phosphatase [Fimbriimonadaceae bacterium]